MPGSIKIDDGSGNYTILTNAGSLGSDKTITIPNETGTLNLQSGSVLQVVQGTFATQTSSTSSTHADTGLSLSITPSATSSKILVMMLHHTKIQRNTTSANATVKLLRDSTEIENANHFFTDAGGNAASTQNLTASVLDSPSTTSAITYKTTFGVDNAANSETIYICWGNRTDRLIAMEIGG